MHDLALLTNLALIFTVAVGLGLVFVRFGMPPVLAYVLAGTVLGPPGLALVPKDHDIMVIAELGVIVLLFTIGLEFSLHELKRAWRAILLAGSGQVFGTTLIVFVGAVALGLPWQQSLLWGGMIALSSTAVVLRLLESRGEHKAAHGRLVTGVLIFQDLCIVPMMLLVPMLAGKGNSTLGGLAQIAVIAVCIVVIVIVASQQIVPRLLKRVANTRNREMFLLSVLAIAGVTAWITSLTGLSLALGAFLAGVVLADTEYAHQAMADVLPLRAVMMCVFFVSIGMLFDIELLLARPFMVLGFMVFLVVTKLIVMLGVGLVLRFPVEIAALSAVALAQVGEFSFILADAGAKAGLITEEQLGLFLTASVVTIAITPVGLSQFPRLLAGTRALAPLERWFDTGTTVVEQGPTVDAAGAVLVAGLGVGGRTLVAALERAGIRPVIIELNPDTVAAERARGREVVYGDVTSEEVLLHAGLRHAAALVLVVSDLTAAHRAVEVARELHPHLPIILRTRFAADEGAERLAGIEVLSEEFSGAATLAGMVLRRMNIGDWQDIVTDLVREHNALAVDDEGTLPPPYAHTASADAAARKPPSEA